MSRGGSIGFHALRILGSLAIGRNDSKEETFRKTQTRGDSLEAKILGSMAKGGRKKHKFLPSLHDP